MKIAKLDLQTHCLSALRDFYLEILEFPLLDESETHFTIATGASQIRFTQVTDGSRPFYHFAFNIPENKVGEARVWLKQRVELQQDEEGEEVYFSEWNSHAVYFLDPAGNILEFIGRHPLRNATEHPFSQRDVLCVSEIGLPVDDVLKRCDQIQQNAGIPVYQTGSSTFTALGDEHGLFIVVPIGRIWFMSDRAAEVHPTRVTIHEDQDVQLNISQYTIQLVKENEA